MNISNNIIIIGLFIIVGLYIIFIFSKYKIRVNNLTINNPFFQKVIY